MKHPQPVTGADAANRGLGEPIRTAAGPVKPAPTGQSVAESAGTDILRLAAAAARECWMRWGGEYFSGSFLPVLLRVTVAVQS